MNAVLVVGCLYEVLAITTKKAPTITRVLKGWGNRHHLGRLTLWLWCGYISWHFLEPMEESE